MPKRPIMLAAFSLAMMIVGQPAFAGNGSLSAGTQALSQGDYAGAVKQLSAALSNAKLSPEESAKALYQRGVAQRMLGKQSGAIADLSQAIWLGGLSSGEKMRAHVYRGMAYQASGLGAQAQSDIAEARKIDAGGVDRMLAANQGAASAPVRAPQPPAPPVAPAAPQAAEAPVQLQPKRAEAPRQPEPAAAEAPKQVQPRAAQLPPSEDLPAAWQTQDAVAAEREEKSGNRVSRFFGGITDRVRGWTGRESEEPAVQQPLSNDEWAATVMPAEKPKRIAQKQEPAQPQAQQPAAPPQQQIRAAQPQQAQLPAQAPQPVGQPQQLQPPRQQVARAAAPDVPQQPVQPEAPRAPQPVQQAAAGGGGGGYLLQLASARSAEDANAAWQSISSKNARLVGGRPPIVKQANLGSLGTFYRVHIGPFQDKAQSVELCNEFKRQGVDCFLVTR